MPRTVEKLLSRGRFDLPAILTYMYIHTAGDADRQTIWSCCLAERVRCWYGIKKAVDIYIDMGTDTGIDIWV